MKGTGTLVRLALRRERLVAPAWILVVVMLATGLISYITTYFPTQQELAVYAETIGRNPIFLAIGGPVPEPSLGAMAAQRSGGLLYLLAGLAALLSVVRHTRAEEENGRLELLAAGAIGRRAPVAAALLVAGLTSLVAGALTTAALVARGIEPTGSIAYGASITAAGWVFAAIAAVAAQLVRRGRTVTTISLSALGVAYALRYLGDATGLPWLTYLSPLGWSHLVRAYAEERWWMLAVPVIAAAVLAAVACALVARRDLGGGLLPERAGPAGAPSLRGPISLAWRLNRGLLAKWTAGVTMAALVFAGVSNLTPQLADQPGHILQGFLHRYGGPSGSPVDAYLWLILLLFAYTVALFPVLMVQRLRAEESSGRAEAVLAAGVSRIGWAGGHVVVAALGTAGLLVVGGGVTGVVYSLVMGDLGTDLPRIVGAAAGHVPAAWLVGAVAVLAYGMVPRAAVAISWAVWAVVFVCGDLLGPLVGLWGWSRVEPFHYVPNTVSGEPYTMAPVVLGVLSALLLGLGLVGLRRRDLQ
ncbi:polyketide antibiotic transporter [Nonomuraea sp. NPDC046570]|uniref:ABC transporter permease n=1 Tax=Nonomuraea sp. NPDC046570 TaxID=3155255 RepID=UPI0033D440E7